MVVSRYRAIRGHYAFRVLAMGGMLVGSLEVPCPALASQKGLVKLPQQLRTQQLRLCQPPRVQHIDDQRSKMTPPLRDTTHEPRFGNHGLQTLGRTENPLVTLTP